MPGGGGTGQEGAHLLAPGAGSGGPSGLCRQGFGDRVIRKTTNNGGTVDTQVLRQAPEQAAVKASGAEALPLAGRRGGFARLAWELG